MATAAAYFRLLDAERDTLSHSTTLVSGKQVLQQCTGHAVQM